MAVERVKTDRPEEYVGNGSAGDQEGAFNLDSVFAADPVRMQAIKAGRYLLLGVKTNYFKPSKWQEFLQTPGGQFLTNPEEKLEGRTPLSFIEAEVALTMEESKRNKSTVIHKARKTSHERPKEVDWINRNDW